MLTGVAPEVASTRYAFGSDSGSPAVRSAASNTADLANNDASGNSRHESHQSGVQVAISPEGAQAVARMQTEEASSDAAAAGTNSDTGTGSGSENTTSAETTDASPAECFVCGTLGLERPDQPESNRNASYTAGRWLAAGLAIGGLIALVA